MQPQSDIDSKNKQTAATTQQSLPTTAAPTATNQEQNRKLHHHHRSPKIIKGKKPLIHFKFYLDIRDHQLTKTIEEKITSLGGCLEFFLTQSITHFVTDKQVCNKNNNNNNNTHTPNLSRPPTPQTPVTPGTPHTPYSYEQSPCESIKNAGSATNAIGSSTTTGKKQSRADAMLNRARRPSTTHTAAIYENSNNNNNNNNNNSNKNNPNLLVATPTYIIWSTEYALRFFKRISHDLKDYLEGSTKKAIGGKPFGTVEPISLKGGFIKIEAIKRNQRPYYQLFRKPTEWPKIELHREDGAFRLSPKRKPEPEHVDLEPTKMTRKSRSRSSQHRATTKEAGLHALKKSAGDVGVTKSSNGRLQPHSTNAEVGATAAAVACKQLKETSEKQCGVCEICKIEYDTLTIHLKTKDHEYFAKNTQNFIALDTLIHASADVNKFLDANKSLEARSELEEEMEVVEDVTSLDTDAADPLEDHQPSQTKEKRRSVHSHKTPSPSLREKSKRSTKGKHSSEKFQNICGPKTARSTSVSPQKKTSSACSSKLELQAFKNDSATPSPAPSATSRKKPAVSVISPPIRAMLPPSSLYKVVETSLAQDGCCTPPRKQRDAGDTAAIVASPSLIVKFKKVRQTELSRLNGEAENFMFPRRRTSSELPTDQDRQTTSENALHASVSSTSISLDSTSEQQVDEVISENIENNEQVIKAKPMINSAAKRQIVVAKRRKGRPSKQSFRIAPIQPEELTLKSLLQTPGRTNSVGCANAELVATSLTLPEATRKSSRTATAIVTAATTSSRLLRAAVEAAKNNQRLGNDSSSRRRSSATPSKMMEMMTATAGKQIKNRAQTALVVKLEDRMGEEDTDEESHRAESIDDNKIKKMKNVYVDDDDEDDDIDSYVDDDDDDDEDYVGNFRAYSIKTQLPTIAANRQKRFSSNNRDQRASNRATKKCIKLEAASIASSDEDDYNDDNDDDDDEDYVGDDVVVEEKPSKPKTKRTPKPKPKPKPSPVKKNSRPAATAPPASHLSYSVPQKNNIFDFYKSERFKEHQYAFERVPVSDLWFRVFNRQDAGEEQIFEYYGSTNYRKLPYELGPIPFNRTLDGISCKLCGIGDETGDASTSRNAGGKKTGSDVEVKKCKSKLKTELEPFCTKAMPDAATTSTTAPSSPTLFGNYTHKKLHLLQRYRREQQEMLQKQQQADLLQKLPGANKTAAAFPNKASTPDREAHERRAGSIHSNASSCASSTDTTYSKKFPRNKHLNKAAFLNLELPPRKSPREHASTLALVSCLIKQRQNSQSKPNSETDEPNTPTPPVNCVEEELEARKQPEPTPISAPAPVPALVPAPVPAPTPTPDPAPPALEASLTVRSTRSAAGTPVEEIRFATEISENVKRLRRGQNKYNHSPTIEPTVRAGVVNIPSTQGRQDSPTTKLKRRRRQPSKYHSYTSVVTKGKKPSIRKTGSKKGVLEFEVDAAALKALDTAKQHTNVRLLEWQIDKYLEYSGRTLDFDAQESELIARTTQPNAAVKESKRSAKSSKAAAKAESTNTPPATDYFSSDFDLYDLFTSTPTVAASTEKEQSFEQQQIGSKKAFSLYSSVALQNYFKKRKSLKSNRTGWPKVQKKKSSVRQQQQLTDKICFLQPVSEKPVVEEGLSLKPGSALDNGEDQGKEQTTRQSVVITPPDSDDIEEDNDDDGEEEDDDDDEEDEDAVECKTVDNDTELDVAESIPEEEDYADTIADDSVDDREADVEEDDDDDDEGDVAVIAEDEDQDHVEDEAADDDDTLVNYEPPLKRARRATAVSPVEKISSTTNITVANVVALAATTSTPSTQLLRSLRRSTPHLNGSLGSCVSPSEKAGDNSDIFTVSSDGLDTDLDLSNSHSALLKAGAEEHETHCVNHTPKRKFDLAKYAANNNAAATSTCAAEAATVNAKSLAISQFLKKEVKVTCRRLRAPFRRFRYRR